MDMTFGYKDHRDYENTPQNEGKECLGSMLPLMQSYYDTLQHRPARISSLKQNPDIGGNCHMRSRASREGDGVTSDILLGSF
jgi:hypothetical protein